MIIFLYGQDSYRLGKEADSIVEKYKKKHPSGLNFSNFDLERDSIGEVDNYVRTLSFFDEVKLAVIKNSFLNSSTPESLLDLINGNNLLDNKAVVLLFRENFPAKDLKTKNSKLFILLTSDRSLSRNFEVMDGRKLEDWIKRCFQERNCSISGVLARNLISSVGDDTNRLTCEIDKLSSFKLKGEIESGDIENLVNRDIETNIFSLLDAITARNKVKALELLYTELKNGRDPHYLLTMFVHQIRNMMVLKDLLGRNLGASEIAKMTKIHPFVISKLKNSLNQDFSSIRDRFNYLAQTDQLSKQGRADIEDRLYNLVLNA